LDLSFGTQFLEMRDHGTFGHSVCFWRNVGVDRPDDFCWLCNTRLNCRKNVLLALEPVIYVLVEFSVRSGDCRSVAAKQNRQVRKRTQALECFHIIDHVSFGRVNQDRAKTENIISGQKNSSIGIVKTKMTACVARSVQRAKVNGGFAMQSQKLTVLNQVIHFYFTERFRSCFVCRNTNVVSEVFS